MREPNVESFLSAARALGVEPRRGYDPFGPLDGFRVLPSPNHPRTHKVVRYPAHPIVAWLARWLPITPYTEARYPIDADPIVDERRGVVYCSLAQWDAIRSASILDTGSAS